MDDISVLSIAQPPHTHFSHEAASQTLSQELRDELPGFLVVELDGAMMRNEGDLFDICDEAFDLGVDSHSFIGKEPNWCAFEDSMSSSYKVTYEAEGCVLLIRNAENCLRTSVASFIQFGNIMANTGGIYANPNQYAMWGWDRPSQPFHTIFLYGRMPRQVPQASPINLSM